VKLAYLCTTIDLKMKHYRTKNAFEAAFKKFVHNFDETKMLFTYSKNEVLICFVEDGKLKKFPMYKNEYYIHLNGWRFIEFLETGKFPLQSYVMVYDDKDINPEDIGKVFEFEYVNDGKWEGFEMFNYSNVNTQKFLAEYRVKYPACGMKNLPKPGTSPYKNTDF
jgi:hypothetical protein